MPRKPEGDRPLTPAARQERQRKRRAERDATIRKALEKITKAKTVAEARQIAATALVS